MNRVTKPSTPYGTKAKKRKKLLLSPYGIEAIKRTEDRKFPLGQDDIKTFLRQHKIPPTKGNLDEAMWAMRRYLSYRDSIEGKAYTEGRPRSEDTKADANRLMTAIATIAKTVNRLTSEGWKVVGLENRDILEKFADFAIVEQHNLMERLKSMPKGKPGRHPGALPRLISDLADIWEGSTGKKPTVLFNRWYDPIDEDPDRGYYGPFYDFVKDFYQKLEPDASLKALGKMIERVLRDRKEIKASC